MARDDEVAQLGGPLLVDTVRREEVRDAQAVPVELVDAAPLGLDVQPARDALEPAQCPGCAQDREPGPVGRLQPAPGKDR